MRSLADAAGAEWAQERGAVVDIDVGEGGPMRLPRSPFRFSDAVVGTAGRPAWQGEHNREVVHEVLGLSHADIDALERDGVLVERRSSV